MYKIYCDVDGVLADFDGYVKKITGKYPDQMATSELWPSVEPWIAKFEFWNKFDKIPDADKLWSYIKKYDVSFLTAAGGKTFNLSVRQKQSWLKKNFGYNEAIVVRSSNQKSKYANEHAILIDDRKKSIDPWVAAGGIGILHKNAAYTIKELKKLGL
ncbi:MAG: hypothetical protein R3213_11970 [Flavobacteriaceae bacterium]|nr:hypothetical protein [Flavobacteriaceae bacterium]